VLAGDKGDQDPDRPRTDDHRPVARRETGALHHVDRDRRGLDKGGVDERHTIGKRYDDLCRHVPTTAHRPRCVQAEHLQMLADVVPT
jgi:hypothetical protein